MTRGRLFSANMNHVAFGGPSNARGLAVLCGWGGSKLKNVQKYAALWHRAGWRTAAAAMSIDHTFFPAAWTDIGEVSQAIVGACREHRASRGDAVIAAHAFSNGGTFLMLSLLEDDSALRFDGAVYDSAPTKQLDALLPLGLPLVMMSSGQPAAAIARHVPYCLAAMLAYPLGRKHPPPMGLFPKLFAAETNRPRPELFVYGENDRIIPPSHVEAFVRRRKSHGCAVSTLGPLAGGEHCNLLSTHTEEYAKAVSGFAKALEDTPRP